MKLVIDTNIIISAIVRDSMTRKALLSPYFDLYTPDTAISELEKHSVLLMRKTGLSEERFKGIIEFIMDSIIIVPSGTFEKFIPIAMDEMKEIDETDSPFIALALSFSNNGIWSNDRHVQKQKLLRTWTTSEVLIELQNPRKSTSLNRN